MSEKSLKKNAFYSVLKVFLSLVFPLITFPYASRILLPEGIGKINFANTIIYYFVIIASLGIGSYATREAVKVRDDKFAISKLFKEIFLINSICCIISFFLFFISLNFITKLSEYRNILLICSINIVFSIDWIYTAYEEFKYFTIRSFVVQLICVLYLFLFVHTSEDILYYAFFGVLINIGNNSLNIIFLPKYVNLRNKTKLEIKKHLKPVFIFFGITIVTSIYSLFDTTMLGFLSTNTEVGYYTASTKLGHMVLSMLTALTSVLLPRLTDYAQKNDEIKFQNTIIKTSNILILLSVPITTGIILLSKPLITLLSGEQYLPSIPTMRIISPIIIIISLANLIGAQILPAIGKEKISFFSYIVGAITNISINSFLIPNYGSLGAAIGTVFAELIVLLVQIFFVRKTIINKDLFITLFESICGSIIFGIIIFFILRLFTNIFMQLIFSFFLAFIIYASFLYLIKNKYFLYYWRMLINKLITKLKTK